MTEETKALFEAHKEFDIAFETQYGNRTIAVSICVLAAAILIGVTRIAGAIRGIIDRKPNSQWRGDH